MGETTKSPMVVMTNGDTYRVSKEAAKEIKMFMATPDEYPKSSQVIDEKTWAEVTIAIANVSSVVVPAEAQNA